MTISNALSARLAGPSLLKTGGLINGTWLEASSAASIFDIANPANGEVIATLAEMGPAETKTSIDAAYEAQKAWAAKPGKERAMVLRNLYDLMVANVDDLAIILTMEMGKPLAEAKGEILYGASYVEWFGEEAQRVYGDVIPGHQADKRIVVLKQPIGMVGMITPWNFPNAMLARKMAPALAVGCAVEAKPAEQTPLSAMALAVLAERAGLPAGLFNIITGTDGPAIGKAMCASDKLRKISFTGSTQVGRILMRQGADKILRLGLDEIKYLCIGGV